jgi:putative membrane protein
VRHLVGPGFDGRFGGDHLGWWAVPRLVLAAAFLVLVVMACLALFHYLSGRGGRFARHVPAGDAERILRERFARGEIDVEEFQSRREALDGRQRASGSGASGT